MRLWLRIAIASLCALALGVAHYLALIRPGVDTLPVTLFGRQLELLAPERLGLLCLLPYLWLIASSSLVDLSRLQQALSAGVRTLLLATLVLALTRPSVVAQEKRISAVFLVDVSDSVSDDQLQAARRIVERSWRARGDNEMQLITFAERPKVVALPGGRDGAPLPEIVRHLGQRAGQHSDIQAAIQHAYGLFPADRLPRIVLLSDGNETSGDLVAEAYNAASKEIVVHAHRLPDRQQKEVLIRTLAMPEEVRMGAPFELTATVDSTHPTRATFTLYKDEFINALDGRKTLELAPGENQVKFKSMVREAGLVSLRLVMSGVAGDTWKSNNTATAILPVHGRPRVLYVEGEPDYAGYLQRALESEQLEVVVRGPHGLPASATQLASFDALILSDVAAMHVGPGQMAAIHSYVRDLGGGFIMAGGQNSFGAGGYYGTRIEQILPVRFDTERKRDQPSIALVLCIDRSGSMSGPKIELAKEAAKATTELLSGADLISVVAFDSSAHVVVRLQRAANRLRILNDISQLVASGGTSIRPALQESYNQLQGAAAKVKHVILLSDGQSSYGGIPELVDEMAASRITVSAVGVGGGADRTLLQMIAERGNGRFYHTNDASNIPKIFTKETTQVARSALVEELVKVHVAKRASVIKGVPIESAPYLRGYVSTKAKPLAETILVSEHGEPILAIWRLGLGKTAAFTSDVKNRWAVDWLRWPGYNQFWAQVVREMMRHRIQRSFSIRARAEQGLVNVAVDAIDRDDRFINGLDSDVTLLDPQRPRLEQRASLRQTAAGRYEASLRLSHYGAFLVRARHRIDGKVIAESLTSVAVPYPKEYTDLVQDQQRVRRLVRVAGGTIDPTPAALFSPGEQRIRYHRDLWSWPVFLALSLLLLDVLLRRVRLFGYRRETL